MNEQKNSDLEPGKTEHESEAGRDPSVVGDVELETNEPMDEEDAVKPGLLHAFRRSFERGWQAQRDPKKDKSSRQELRKDKTKSLLALAGFAGAMILMFVLVFSSPSKTPRINQRPPGTPDLGRRVTPGQQAGSQENVTPLMTVKPASGETANNNLSTPQDVALTATPAPSSTTPQSAPPSTGAPFKHTLAQIDFQDQALEQQYAMHGTNPPVASATAPVEKTDDLKTASLVFVHAREQATKARTFESAVEESAVMDLLPVGTHLVARLEAPVSTALTAPVVAVIEYNYEQDGEIILAAGTQVIGKLRGATPQGYVSLDFNELEFSDGTTQKIAADAMGLDYKPLKGHVTGRNRGLRFLVQSLTGVGEVAAYMVGGSPGSTSVFSEDALLREQLAANMAMAGQQQFNQLAMTQHIVVTVPGNTRFYLVLEQGATPKSASATLRPVLNPSGLPNKQELMELMELKRELAAAAQSAGGTSGNAVAASRP
ncbi:MAG TPA: hypothetical protein VFZ08_03450 [Terriglobia bacterium]|nr:hypothetical protein [Terriglobia bacterium]